MIGATNMRVQDIESARYTDADRGAIHVVAAGQTHFVPNSEGNRDFLALQEWLALSPANEIAAFVPSPE